MAKVEAQDLVKGRAYSDGCKVFTVRRVRADGPDRTIVTTRTGRRFIANNDQGFTPKG